MLSDKSCATFFVMLLSSGYVLAGEDTYSVRVRDGDKTYEFKEMSSGNAILLTPAGEALRIKCDEEAVEKIAAPTSNLSALIYIRDCGATTDFATHVAIVGPNDKPTIIAVFAGKPNITVEWGVQSLEVFYSQWPSELIYKQDTKAKGINIRYKISDKSAAPTDPKTLAFSSFNFGATGRATGLPAEILLRWAGWWQKASGLYKPEWGAWSGNTPYGDDPSGSTAIVDGIQFYEARDKR